MAIYFTENTNSIEEIEQMNKVIEKANKSMASATENINNLTDLNTKAEELSNNVGQALPINTDLKKNIEIGQPLVQEAESKNTELQTSLEETKKFIDGLDGSQNIPQIRLDVTELQNGLKSNQALAYTGSSITCKDTLEGRTEGMRIGGKTLQNLVNGVYTHTMSDSSNRIFFTPLVYNELEPGDYTIFVKTAFNKDTAGTSGLRVYYRESESSVETGYRGVTTNNGYSLVKINIPVKIDSLRFYVDNADITGGLTCTISELTIAKGDYNIANFFEGIKSFGEEEHKISILSTGKNLFDFNQFKTIDGVTSIENGLRLDNLWAKRVDIKINLEPNTKYYSSYKYQVVKPSVGQTDTGGGKILLINPTNNKTIALFNQRGGDSIFTTPENIKEYTQVYLYSDGGGGSYNGVVEITDLMLSKSQVKETYEPYKQDKKDILIKEPLRSVGNIQDVLYEDDGQVKVERVMGQDTLNGDENIERRVMVDETKTIGFGIQVSNLVNCKIGGNCLCNNFKYSYPDLCWNTDNECVSISDFLHFRIDKSKLSTPDIAGFKAWLKANPTTIVYQLATPTTEIVENCVDVDLDTYQDVTYVNIENSIKGTLEFKVASNIGSMVQNMAKEVNNIWDVINNMILPGMAEIVDKTVQASLKLANK
ncbi:MAG: BppU family phage baseplate upper protein [Clostridium chrysemydis]|uniref:BppU family phage baseplate upper protein n=1 Tax=Clostridium chrysemydis TaxID=2665504 RepID=UPI003F330FDB